MTDKELNELAERHFAPFRAMTWYCVCRDCDEPCVFTQEEWEEKSASLSSNGCFECVEEVLSPLSKDDFTELARHKSALRVYGRMHLRPKAGEVLKNDR